MTICIHSHSTRRWYFLSLARIGSDLNTAPGWTPCSNRLSDRRQSKQTCRLPSTVALNQKHCHFPLGVGVAQRLRQLTAVPTQRWDTTYKCFMCAQEPVVCVSSQITVVAQALGVITRVVDENLKLVHEIIFIIIHFFGKKREKTEAEYAEWRTYHTPMLSFPCGEKCKKG